MRRERTAKFPPFRGIPGPDSRPVLPHRPAPFWSPDMTPSSSDERVVDLATMRHCVLGILAARKEVRRRHVVPCVSRSTSPYIRGILREEGTAMIIFYSTNAAGIGDK